MNIKRILHTILRHARYCSQCPCCSAKNYDENHTMAIVKIPHKKNCPYPKGNYPIKINAIDTKS